MFHNCCSVGEERGAMIQRTRTLHWVPVLVSFFSLPVIDHITHCVLCHCIATTLYHVMCLYLYLCIYNARVTLHNYNMCFIITLYVCVHTTQLCTALCVRTRHTLRDRLAVYVCIDHYRVYRRTPYDNNHGIEVPFSFTITSCY